MIVDGSKIRLLAKKEKAALKYCAQPGNKDPKKCRIHVFSLLPAREQIPGPKYRIMRH